MWSVDVSKLRDARILVTGGTGFIGGPLLRLLGEMDEAHNLKMIVWASTRSPEGKTGPKCVRFVEGDFTDPRTNDPVPIFDYVIHGAATSAAETFHGSVSQIDKFNLAIQSTRVVMDAARRARRAVLLSSGSVYSPAIRSSITEDHPAAPLTTDLSDGLAHGKRAAEFIAAHAASVLGIPIPIARIFSLIGPGLPLDLHYAAGRFIADALHSDRIRLYGDGRVTRSYLHVEDCAKWILTLLLEGRTDVYNVGSPEPVSMKELATYVRNIVAPQKEVVQIETADKPLRPFYVPDVTKAAQELHLEAWTPLGQAIRETADHARGASAAPRRGAQAVP